MEEFNNKYIELHNSFYNIKIKNEEIQQINDLNNRGLEKSKIEINDLQSELESMKNILSSKENIILQNSENLELIFQENQQLEKELKDKNNQLTQNKKHVK